MICPDHKRDATSSIHRISLVAGRGFFFLALVSVIVLVIFSCLGVSSMAEELGSRLPALLAASVGFYFIAWFVFLFDRYGSRSLSIISVLALCAWLATVGRFHMPVASIVVILASLICALGAAVLLITLRVVIHRELKLGANI